MPIESIVVPKAPKGWTPSRDQRQRIQEDARLQRMSRDDQYAFFNKQGTPSTRRPAAAPARGGRRTPQPATGGGVFGWVDSVLSALRGG